MIAPRKRTADADRILAQLDVDGPSTAAHLTHALALLAVADAEFDLAVLERGGLVRRVARAGGAFTRRGWGPTLYELTEPGRLEATGGAQLSIVPRPPIATQPSLF
jgi:hypothetical protein